MYLRELRVQGFKSFADPTKLEFERGVTAIVGPNGCGKSNVADAIRWVLGEQSAKSLRAGAMQEVIFQGATGRKPVNMCEVSLVFTECEDRLGESFHEVEIARRVLRDGGSDYFINGKASRLKDIQRLFLDTGVGQVSYSFMLQGQIDQVLSSNPAERRSIFEEAAGISKYKSQRREALSKLSQVEANLARVTDVMDEVQRQTNSLRRQAGKALRFKRVDHRLRHLALALGSHRFGEFSEKIAELERKASFLEEEVRKIESTLGSEEKGLSQKRSERNELNAQLQTAQTQVYELRSAKEQAENRAEFALERSKDGKARLAAIEKELEALAEEQEQLKAQLAGEIEVKQQQMDLFGNSDAQFREKSSEMAAAQEQLSQAESQFSRERNVLSVKEGSLSRLRANCTTMEVEMQTYQVRHSGILQELQTLKETGEALQQERGELERLRLEREKEVEKQQAHTQQLKEGRAALLQQFRETQGRLQGVEREMAGLKGQIATVEAMQAKFEGFSEGAKALLEGKLEGVIAEGEYRLFLRQVSVGKAWTKAFERLLGTSTDGIFLQNAQRMGPIADALREKRLGWASLLVRNGAPGPFSCGGSMPDFCLPAGEVVSSKDEEIGNFLEQYLQGCYFCEDLNQFLSYWLDHPEICFQSVVTKAGEWVDPRGVVVVGANRKTKEAPTYLVRAQQLSTHKAELNGLESSAEQTREQAAQLQRQLDQQERRMEDQAKRLSEISEELTTLKAQESTTRKSIERNQQSLRSKQGDLERLESTRKASEERLQAANEELQATEKAISEQRERIQHLEAQVVQFREEREQIREAFSQIQLEVAEKRQRLALLDKGMSTLEEKSRQTEHARELRRREIEQIQRQLVEFEEDWKKRVAEANGLDSKIQGIVESIEARRAILRDLDQSIESVEVGLSGRRENFQKLSAEQNSVAVELARQQSKLQFIEEELQRDFGCKPKSIDWRRSLWEAGDELPERIRVDIEEESPEDMAAIGREGEPQAEELKALDSTDWSAIEEEVNSLRTRIHAMGPVNVDAIEEYRALRERFDFLKTQSDDLWQSKEELVTAINEINSTSRELFESTFKQIRKNFKETFAKLFGGGKADLELLDTEDVLESGIEITAQPPGTRLRSLALLSGGQKTMTAVALLFAIYMVKPSPFCVLDEIDAPLDDANIGRFTEMLESFLQFSQFLIITHNKRTISVADSIYGITMQEKGVSKVLSMHFNRNTDEAESA